MDSSLAARTLAVLIPAWRPTEALEQLVEELRKQGSFQILVIDDGSGSAYQPIFDRLAASGVAVRRHAVNLGKGRALKTGFNTLLTDFPGCIGVVTADADGQHTPHDIARVARALEASTANDGKRAVLGVRSLNANVDANADANVPLRSRFGNTLTRHVFAFIVGVRITDTQTGLRGLPLALLPSLLTLPGERYEYEMTMLAHLCRSGKPPQEIPIETVYLDRNRGSHFNPVRDSMRIYFVLVRFYISSLLASALDLLLFYLAYTATGSLLLSILLGRVSSLLNFELNRRFVFRNRASRPASLGASLWRYYALASGVILLSYGVISLLVYRLHWNALLAKLCVDSCLSLATFSVQRLFVFGSEA
ncbi:glycosyltransferase [Silvibacterium sp.]|uniref:glycosyltransferase n=1 Tax=Silvibacterium sp. TaxID=1964179 RepID=UPI0039E23680